MLARVPRDGRAFVRRRTTWCANPIRSSAGEPLDCSDRGAGRNRSGILPLGDLKPQRVLATLPGPNFDLLIPPPPAELDVEVGPVVVGAPEEPHAADLESDRLAG